jgi:hypothetical protein
MIRCKFTCREVVKRKPWRGSEHTFDYVAKFQAVMDGSEENKAFFAATPSGSLEIGVYSDDVFEVGRDYYVDLTPAGT